MFLRNKKSFLAIGAIVIIFLAGILFFDQKNNDVPFSKAASAQNVRGFAWSENIGWISFNSLNCDTDGNNRIDTDLMVPGCGGDNTLDQVFDYGVNIDVSNNLSGFAWSENIGWIKFNPVAPYPICPGTTCPVNPNYSAKYDSGTKKITGWARACAGLDDAGDGIPNNCEGPSRTDGWDGWILMGPVDKGAGNNGAWIDTALTPNEFKGWAWGGEVVGWISFNHLTGGSATEYKVYINNFNTAPTVTPNAPSLPDWCTGHPPNTILSWVFTDLEDDTNNIPQTAYQLIVTRNDGAVYNSGKVTNLAGNSTAITGAAFGLGFMDYGYSYTWTIQVWDSGDLSDPAGPRPGAPFSTPIHAYPRANFTYVLPSPNVGLPVNFTDSTVVYGGATIKKWTWDFGDSNSLIISNPPTVNGNTSNIYEIAGSYIVNLTVQDSTPSAQGGPFTCLLSQTINLTDANLQWEEVTP